jgi:peroxiredoxin
MRKPDWKRVIEAAFWAGLLVLIAVRIGPQVGAALGLGGEGRVAPEIRMQTLAGEEIELADLRGQVVLVNFWATWCAPCRIEMPGLQRVYERYADSGFTILGMSTDIGTPDLVRDFVATHALTFPIGAAPAGARRAFGGGTALPMSFLIDRQGRVRHTVRGIFAEPALAQAVQRLLAEGPPSEKALP